VSADRFAIVGTRVLVVEDEALIAEELQERLARLGAIVVGIVSSGHAAIEATGRHDPDLVLLDIRIKGELDGIDVAERLRLSSTAAVVFLTAHADRDTLDRAKRVHPAGYLLKPVDDTLLRLVLELAIYRHLVGRRLLDAQKLEAIGRISGGMAHDINNLMAIVTGFAEVLIAEAPPGASRQKLEKIQRAGERSAHLTRQLLAFSRQLTLAPEVFDLAAFVTRLVPEIRSTAGSRVFVHVRTKAVPWPVYVDRAQLRTILMSLVDNACRSMAGGGTLTVEVGDEVVPPDCDEAILDALVSGRYASVSIADTGAGMDAELLARVFEPFFRPKPFDRGTGISLAAAYGTVRQSGGTIRVDSESGRGTRVDVLLPRTSDS